MAGLVHARNLQRAAEAESPARAVAIGAFLEAWVRELAPHFRDEEETLTPFIDRALDREQLLAEHIHIRHLITQLGSGKPEDESHRSTLLQLGRALHDHIRWEERILFERIQKGTAATRLGTLADHAARIERDRPGSRARLRLDRR